MTGAIFKYEFPRRMTVVQEPPPPGSQGTWWVVVTRAIVPSVVYGAGLVALAVSMIVVVRYLNASDVISGSSREKDEADARQTQMIIGLSASYVLFLALLVFVYMDPLGYLPGVGV